MAISDNFESSAKIRITGALMAHHVHKAVTVVGDLIKVEPDGKKATMKTTDDQYIQIVFLQPISKPLTTPLLTEAYGVVVSKNQLQCHRIMQFKPEVGDQLDRLTYNEFVVEFVKNCDQHINCVYDDSPEDDTVITPIDNFSLPDDMANENTQADQSFGGSYF